MSLYYLIASLFGSSVHSTLSWWVLFKHKGKLETKLSLLYSYYFLLDNPFVNVCHVFFLFSLVYLGKNLIQLLSLQFLPQLTHDLFSLPPTNMIPPNVQLSLSHNNIHTHAVSTLLYSIHMWVHVNERKSSLLRKVLWRSVPPPPPFLNEVLKNYEFE